MMAHPSHNALKSHCLPATEHSVMTSWPLWPNEIKAINNLVEQFPGQVIACVMDSYDYDSALKNIIPGIVKKVYENKWHFVIRPDSGDSVRQVIHALDTLNSINTIRKTKNKLNYTVIYTVFDSFSVIQGDGIDYEVVDQILNAMEDKKYSAENVAFGMGGGLFQKVNRDKQSEDTEYANIRPNIQN